MSIINLNPFLNNKADTSEGQNILTSFFSKI